jgi:hypothetical protein
VHLTSFANETRVSDNPFNLLFIIDPDQRLHICTWLHAGLFKQDAGCCPAFCVGACANQHHITPPV